MSKIAIDVVLLPSDKMMDTAIKINKELLKNFEPKIVLDKKKCLPHISLCMGCIYTKEIPKLKKILNSIAKDFSKFDLIAEKIKSYTIPTGKVFSGLEIINTKELKALHETIMEKFWSFLSYNVETSMLFNPREVEKISFHWIKGYKKKYKKPNLFYPHITIGRGKTNKFKFPLKFTASKIALCQLGNYCTCRKVIISSNLSSKKNLSA